MIGSLAYMPARATRGVRGTDASGSLYPSLSDCPGHARAGAWSPPGAAHDRSGRAMVRRRPWQHHDGRGGVPPGWRSTRHPDPAPMPRSGRVPGRPPACWRARPGGATARCGAASASAGRKSLSGLASGSAPSRRWACGGSRRWPARAGAAADGASAACVGRHLQGDQAGAQQVGQRRRHGRTAGRGMRRGRTPRDRAAAAAPASRRRRASGRVRADAGAAPRPRAAAERASGASAAAAVATTVRSGWPPSPSRPPSARSGGRGSRWDPPGGGQPRWDRPGRGRQGGGHRMRRTPRSGRRSTAAPDRFVCARTISSSQSSGPSKPSTDSTGAVSRRAPRGGSSQAAMRRGGLASDARSTAVGHAAS